MAGLTTIQGNPKNNNNNDIHPVDLSLNNDADQRKTLETPKTPKTPERSEISETPKTLKTPTRFSFLSRQPKPIEVDVLSKVFPKLVLWRHLVFYAPFFDGAEFESPVLEENALQGRGSWKIYPQRLEQLRDQKASAYAAHRACLRANTILDDLQEDVEAHGVDLLALHKRYFREKQSRLRFRRNTTSSSSSSSSNNNNNKSSSSSSNLLRRVGTRFISLFSFSSRQALDTVAAVSRRTQIPVRQLERALGMYARYMLETHKTALDTGAKSPPVYGRLGAFHEASRGGDWRQRLARLVYDDAEDIASFAVFPRSERNVRGKGAEMLMFRLAVQRCRERYAVELEPELRQGRSREQQGEYNYDEYLTRSAVETSYALADVGRLMGTTLPKSGSRGWESGEDRRSTGAERRRSTREQALTYGPLELMGPIVEDGRRRGSDASTAGTGFWSRKFAVDRCHVDTFEVLPAIFEAGEK